MKIINKNELTVLVIALMLVTAGYLDYLGKNDLEETSAINENEIVEQVTAEQDLQEIEHEVAKIGDAKLVNSIEDSDTQEEERKADEDSYFVSSKLERTTMYSQIIENYQKILDNANVSGEQKAIATQEISKVNQTQNSIMIAENLLLAKGFENCVIFVNDQSISVIIGKEKLEQEEIAQIQNIVSRELKAEANNIHISTK